MHRSIILSAAALLFSWIALLMPAGPTSAADTSSAAFSIPGYGLSLSMPEAGYWEIDDETASVQLPDLPNWYWYSDDSSLTHIMASCIDMEAWISPELAQARTDYQAENIARSINCVGQPVALPALQLGDRSWLGTSSVLNFGTDGTYSLVSRRCFSGTRFYSLHFYCLSGDEAELEALIVPILSSVVISPPPDADGMLLAGYHAPSVGLSLQIPAGGELSDYANGLAESEDETVLAGSSTVFDWFGGSEPLNGMLATHIELGADAEFEQQRRVLELLAAGYASLGIKAGAYTEVQIAGRKWSYTSATQEVYTEGISLTQVHNLYATLEHGRLHLIDLLCLRGLEATSEPWRLRILASVSLSPAPLSDVSTPLKLELEDSGISLLVPGGGTQLQRGSSLWPSRFKKLEQAAAWLSLRDALLEVTAAVIPQDAKLSEAELAKVHDAVMMQAQQRQNMTVSSIQAYVPRSIDGREWQEAVYDAISRDRDLSYRVRSYVYQGQEKSLTLGFAYWIEDEEAALVEIDRALHSIEGLY